MIKNNNNNNTLGSNGAKLFPALIRGTRKTQKEPATSSKIQMDQSKQQTHPPCHPHPAPFSGQQGALRNFAKMAGAPPNPGLCCPERSHPSSGRRSRDNHSRSETRGSGIGVPHGLRGAGFSPASRTGPRARQPHEQLPSLAGQGCGLSASMSKTEAVVPLRSFHPRR